MVIAFVQELSQPWRTEGYIKQTAIACFQPCNMPCCYIWICKAGMFWDDTQQRWEWVEEVGGTPCLNGCSAEKGWCPDVPKPPVEMVPAESYAGARWCLRQWALAHLSLFTPNQQFERGKLHKAIRDGASCQDHCGHKRSDSDEVLLGSCKLQLYEGSSMVIRESRTEQPHRHEWEGVGCCN